MTEKPKVLITDDEEVARTSISNVLKSEFDVKTASSGEAAIDMIKNENFDVVLLDIRMPKMSGIETLKIIYGMKKTIEIIMLTALDDAKNTWEASKGGAFDYITKPFKNDDLILRVKLAAERRRKNLERDMAWDSVAGFLSLALNDRKKYEEIISEWDIYNSRKSLNRVIPTWEDAKFMLDQRSKDPKWYEKD